MGDEANAAGQSTEQGGGEPQKIELTQAEFDAKLQSEADKRVTQALKTAQEKWEKDFNDKLAKSREEIESLAKLKEGERTAKELEIKERDIQEREGKLREDVRQANIKTFCIEQKLDETAKELLTGATEEAWQKQAATLQALVAKAVEAVREAELKPVKTELDQLKAKIGMPGGGSGSGAGEATLDEYKANPSLTQAKYREIAQAQGVDAAKAWLKTIYPE